MSRQLVPLAARVGHFLLPHRGTLGLFFACTAALFALYSLAWREEALKVVGPMAILLPMLVADVCADFRGGQAAFWLQRPVSPVRFYLTKFAEAALASVGLVVLYVGAVSVAALLLGGAPESHPMLQLPLVAMAAVTLSAVGFGLSAWLPGGARLALAGFVAISLSAVVVVEVRPGVEDWLAVRVVQAALWPIRDLTASSQWILGDRDSAIGPLLRIATHVGAWTALGAWGVGRAVSSGRMAGADR